ncbi:MAG: hypothetical protein A3A33_02475 [Candidatus Yanofskybacteria bacterium RIFCSPLOWO2_01_FULL_49_25]|uniref:Cell division protein FtsX n=1 Tax=Candidatus Yanofskybacteria bacterium RIFCSPLOWO2_01_FULL_49_25 TaxID=1802701 RepID=A0A1F8GRZ6_9BACT|nr:MAG: hypothetical protein A3A33_02475 [Candidatus Yanofskybacteria bacterium RIFCSPLOWO2_01_FULL_49_25]
MKHSLGRIFKVGWTNFKRNSYLSIAVTGVMALALLLLLGLFAFQFLTGRIVTTLEGKVDISAYFKQDANEDHILTVKSDLEKREDVVTVQYISRAQALTAFKELHKNDQLIQESLNQLEDNPLTASLNIKADTPSHYADIAKFLDAHQYKNELNKVNFYENQEVISRIERFSSTLRSWGLITTLLIALIAVLITFNTIRLTIYNQRQEIEIMRLVGASNWHIRGPYLAEGAFYGWISALIALIIFYPIVYLVSGKLMSFAPDVDLFHYFLVNSIEIVLLVVLVGTLIGVLSSVIAIRKHLKI